MLGVDGREDGHRVAAASALFSNPVLNRASMMDSKQSDSFARQRLAELEKELAGVRDKLAQAKKLNQSLTRQAQRAEQERRRQQETFELISRHGSDVLALLGRDGKIGFLTNAVQLALGFTPEELQGRFLHEICPPEDAPKLASFLSET